MIRGLLVALLLIAGTAGAQSVRFGVFGDMPYNRWEREHLPELIAEMNAAKLDFVIHVGDLKGGSEECSDKVYAEMLRRFDESVAPLIYVPGDNDWTDCHRWTNGGYDPIERLNHLRGVFHASPHSLGQRRLALLRQAAYPENVRWRQGPLMVVTLNIQGSRNNWSGTGWTGPVAEFLERDAANRDWLEQAFTAARREGSAGLVIAIQANPEIAREDNQPYRRFLDQLRAETQSFPGQVLLVHGDSHRLRIDQPLKSAEGRPIPNFTRLITFGSPNFGWVRVDVQTSDRKFFEIVPKRWNPTPAF